MPFSPAGPESLSIRRRLRAAVDGRVATADDADYDQARALFYGGFDRRPRAMHELDGVVGEMLLLPATVETVAGFVAAAEAAPEAGERALAPFRALATPLADLVRPIAYLGDDGPARIRQAYPGPTWERLVAVKRRWDPTNLFRHNHNIPPGGQAPERVDFR
jgi:hypothetical protein